MIGNSGVASLDSPQLETSMAEIKRLIPHADIPHAEAMLLQCITQAPETMEYIGEDYTALRIAQCKSPAPRGMPQATRARLFEHVHPLIWCFLTDDPYLHFEASQRWFERNAKSAMLDTRWSRATSPIDVGRKLRIGYVSNHLRKAPIGLLCAGMFEERDSSRFEIFAYNTAPVSDDPVQIRIRYAVDHWRDVHQLRDEEIAEVVARDGIDILVDLDGCVGLHRVGVFARHPAPIQVNWLGYPGTMASPVHHYIIADAFTLPQALESYFSETVVRLPCYQPNDRARLISDASPSRASLGLPDDVFVFCCFSASHKITPHAFACWMQILLRTEKTVLWLLDMVDGVADRLRSRALSAGVDPSRLVFAPVVANEEHLARYPLADLVIDTAPYGGHTTTSDALWMGVPVLTYAGRSFHARVSANLVQQAEIPELVCQTPGKYVERAVSLASTERAELIALRDRLRRSRDSCGLFDTKVFTRSLERAFMHMAEEYRAGRRPTPMTRPPRQSRSPQP